MAVYCEITCDQAVLTDASRAQNGIARVLRSARERSLAIYIELPRDMTGAPTAAVPVLLRRAANPDALIECADEVIKWLAAAKAGAIVVDVEIPAPRSRRRRYGFGAQARASSSLVLETLA